VQDFPTAIAYLHSYQVATQALLACALSYSKNNILPKRKMRGLSLARQSMPQHEETSSLQVLRRRDSRNTVFYATLNIFQYYRIAAIVAAHHTITGDLE
jgi:hypothetical protein